MSSVCLVPACGTPTFECAATEQCTSKGITGRCEAEGVCSLPDDACSSGWRYSDYAGSRSEECVEGSTASIQFAGSISTEGLDTAQLDLDISDLPSVEEGTPRLILAFVSSATYVASISVASEGGEWTKIEEQCSGRSTTGIGLWRGPSGASGPLTARLAESSPSMALMIAAFDGASPELSVLAATNPLGQEEGCDGGTDSLNFDVAVEAGGESFVAAIVAARGRPVTGEPGLLTLDAVIPDVGDDAGINLLRADSRALDDGVLSGSLANLSPADWAFIAFGLR